MSSSVLCGEPRALFFYISASNAAALAAGVLVLSTLPLRPEDDDTLARWLGVLVLELLTIDQDKTCGKPSIQACKPNTTPALNKQRRLTNKHTHTHSPG